MPLDLKTTLDGRFAYEEAEYVIIAAPTDYDPYNNYFDTSIIEDIIEQVIEGNPTAYIVIKSTVPIGYTKTVREKYHTTHILLCYSFFQSILKRFRLLTVP